MESWIQLFDTAWVAGFIDGEGTFRSKKNQSGTISLELSISQVEKEPLERVVSTLGYGVIYGPQIKKAGRPIYQYSLSKSLLVIDAFTKLKPHLCSIKIKQAEAAIEKFNTRPYTLKNKRSRPVLEFCKLGHSKIGTGKLRHCPTCKREAQRKYDKKRRGKND